MLDEPTSGLDPAQLVGIREMIRELAKDKLVILSTHILSEVESLCDRVILINKGRIVGDGTVNELASQVGAGAWMEFVVAEGEVTTAHLAALEEVQSVRLLSDEHATIKRFRVAGNAALGTALSGLAAQHGWQLSRSLMCIVGRGLSFVGGGRMSAPSRPRFLTALNAICGKS